MILNCCEMFLTLVCFLNLLSSLHLLQAPANEKLPVLYLVDSIVKNVGGEYLAVFAKNLITSFICVFEKVKLCLRLVKHSVVMSLLFVVCLASSVSSPALTADVKNTCRADFLFEMF